MQWELSLPFFCVAFLVEVSAIPDSECAPPLFFKCHTTSKCISYVFVCDGEGDCADHSDEDPKQCKKELDTLFVDTCKPHEFQCGDRFDCIPEDNYCDGKKDCIDGSDEVDCHKNKTCNGYKCSSGQCIRRNWDCDGVQDCSDGSDELNCSLKHVVPPANCNSTIDKYLCGNRKRCIDLALVCNNIDDCGDDSDENVINCADAMEACKSSPCSSKCRPTPGGYRCACSPGYILKNDVCEDIDECQQFDLCNQTCINTFGTYYCDCEIGYRLLDDERNCKFEGPAMKSEIEINDKKDRPCDSGDIKCSKNDQCIAYNRKHLIFTLIITMFIHVCFQ